MLNRKLFKLFILLGVIILIFAFFGCGQASKSSPIGNDDAPKIENDEANGDQQTDEKNANKTFADSFEENISFRAYQYIKEPGFSRSYNLDVGINDGKIYLNGVEYEQSAACEPPKLFYSDIFTNYIEMLDQLNGNSEVADALKKIEESNSCYILENKDDNIYGERIAVYKIDNDYYFVSVDKTGKVLVIHHAFISDETGGEEEWQELFIDNFPKYHDSNECLPITLYANGAYSYVPKMDITIKGGEIYINDVLFRQTEVSEPPVIVYSSSLKSMSESEYDYTGIMKKSEVLQKIQESARYYVLTHGENPSESNKVYVYRVGDALYFLRYGAGDDVIRRVYYTIIDDDK